MVSPEELRQACERDIDVVLRACMPDDFFTPDPEPKLVGLCMHPYQRLIFATGDHGMNAPMACGDCRKELTKHECDVRLQEWRDALRREA